jgi:hypothetical protein
MAYTEIVQDVLSIANQKANSAWGFTHELGHNHEWGSWMAPPISETACNWWSIYVNKEVSSFYLVVVLKDFI